MAAAMDAVGVDGALLISLFSMYRYDASYALEVLDMMGESELASQVVYNHI